MSEIMDRLKANISSPDIYEPPTIKQLLTLIEEIENDLELPDYRRSLTWWKRICKEPHPDKYKRERLYACILAYSPIIS